MPGCGIYGVIRTTIGFMNDPVIYAHTLDGRPCSEWEPLYGPGSHTERIAEEMSAFRIPFIDAVCASPTARHLMNLLAVSHDMGKAAADFQSYLLRGGGAVVDHKSAAARWWCDSCPGVGYLMAYASHGHHGGLGHGGYVFEQVEKLPLLPEVKASLPKELRGKREGGTFQSGHEARTNEEKRFALMMAVRMFHSCLVDADWLATESFCEPEKRGRRAAQGYKALSDLSAELELYISDRERGATGKINELRRLIHCSCYSAAAGAPGVFSLNVPTGGGKSLSSLSFALKHAALHGLERVIYVIPYTSIIDQTAREFRCLFGDAQVVEHHSNIAEEVDSEGNRFATENWDAPIIITTAVQFFESLFACNNSRCRKIHNIAHSVVVFDEVQCLPTNLLNACLLAMKTLQRDYGCTILLCTATQPVLTNHDGFEIGWPEQEVRSLLGVALEQRLAREMRRVKVELLGTLSMERLVEYFLDSGADSALMIVNLTRQAQQLYELLQEKSVQGLYHLSARMCSAHRMKVLESVCERLRAGLPTVLVATRVVEAGVDISFPVVYRDSCGLDSLAQAAGRCNRHGERPQGQVFCFCSEEYPLPACFVDMRDGVYAMQDTLAMLQPEDLFAPQVVADYFKRFYAKRKLGSLSWDKAGIVRDYIRNSSLKEWDFPAIARKFRFIEQSQCSLVVPYGEHAEDIRRELLDMECCHPVRMPGRSLYRRLQAYSVSVYNEEWAALLPHCECVHRKAGIWMLADSSLYDAARGLLRESEQITDYVL